MLYRENSLLTGVIFEKVHRDELFIHQYIDVIHREQPLTGVIFEKVHRDELFIHRYNYIDVVHREQPYKWGSSLRRSIGLSCPYTNVWPLYLENRGELVIHKRIHVMQVMSS